MLMTYYDPEHFLETYRKCLALHLPDNRWFGRITEELPERTGSTDHWAARLRFTCPPEGNTMVLELSGCTREAVLDTMNEVRRKGANLLLAAQSKNPPHR